MARKAQETKHVSFRMPLDVYADYLAVAESRGVDMSALLNWVVVDYRPAVLLRRAENEAAMLRAKAGGLMQLGSEIAVPQEFKQRLDELVRLLQDTAAKWEAARPTQAA